MRKAGGIIAAVIILVFAAFIYYRYYYVFGEGVKSGQLNYLVKKGHLFKTYEGKVIQSGIRSRAPGTVQSYEFEFSVTDEKIADMLMKNSGKDLDLHYKEYNQTLPWRGFTKYIVDSVYAMREAPGGANLIGQ